MDDLIAALERFLQRADADVVSAEWQAKLTRPDGASSYWHDKVSGLRNDIATLSAHIADLRAGGRPLPPAPGER
ncbi:MAG: hypothetical protein EBS50_12040 [Sphingomonadaceae bacterium]|nr:hypothetical protein [Sphingomonadaceae bacterium]